MDISAVLLRMLRLRALAVILIFAAVALVTNGYAIERHPGSVLLVALLLAGWYVNGTCINDLADEAIDKINLPKAVGRPLANGNASRRQLTVLASGAALFVVLLSAALDYRLAILSIAMLLLNWLYSMPPVRISYRGVFAPLLLPLGYVLYPYLAAVYVQHIALVRWDFVLLAALYVGFIGRIVLKDFRDVKGDRQYHKRTFIVRYGPRATIIFSAAFWSLGSVLLIGLYWHHSLLLCAVVALHAAGIGYGLLRLYRTGKAADQQVIIGSLGRLATITLLCLLVVAGQQTELWHMPAGLNAGLVALVGLYGLAFCVQTMRHPETARVVF